MIKPSWIQNESDEGLFILMASAELPEDKVIADQAFTEIHRRYAKPLYARCIQTVSSYPDPETLAQELTSATLARAYDRAETYQPHSTESSNRSTTLAWLCRIALNMFRDYLRNPKRPGPLNLVELEVNAELYSPEDFATLYRDSNKELPTMEDHRLIASAFDTLDSREKRVMIETLVFRDQSPGGTYMLRGRAELLANRLDTTSANVRRIRRESIRKINEYVDKHRQSRRG